MKAKDLVQGACVVVIALGVAASVAQAAAQAVDGLAAMHDMRREGRRLCFSDHFHYGSSNGASSKRAAEIAAIASWSDFTAFEYGASWSSYAKSGSKEMTCSRTSSGWGCDVSSRPCR